MSLDDYKVVLCHALMPTREEALAELAGVFEVIEAGESRSFGTFGGQAFTWPNHPRGLQ